MALCDSRLYISLYSFNTYFEFTVREKGNLCTSAKANQCILCIIVCFLKNNVSEPVCPKDVAEIAEPLCFKGAELQLWRYSCGLQKKVE